MKARICDTSSIDSQESSMVGVSANDKSSDVLRLLKDSEIGAYIDTTIFMRINRTPLRSNSFMYLYTMLGRKPIGEKAIYVSINAMRAFFVTWQNFGPKKILPIL